MTDQPSCNGIQTDFMLRFPFRPVHWFTDLESEYIFKVDEFECSLTSEQPYLVISVKPFSSEKQALAFIPRLWGALTQISVELKIGFSAETQLSSITWADDPYVAAQNFEKCFGIPNIKPIDGLADGRFPVIYPPEKNLRFERECEGGTLTQTFPSNIYIEHLSKAIGKSTIADLYKDEKLRTVMDLWKTAQTESSLCSKFLNCVTALEVLANPVPRHDIAQCLLNQLNQKIEEQLPSYQSDSDEHHALESLQRELVHKKKASLRSSIRKMVLDCLKDLPVSESIQRNNEAVRVYDLRCTLLHNGTVDDNELRRAHSIAYWTLIDLLARRVKFD